MSDPDSTGILSTQSVRAWSDYLCDALDLPHLDVGSIEAFPGQALSSGDFRVADYVLKMLIRNRSGQPVAIGLCSPPVAPGLVARGMHNARTARAMLGEDLAVAILVPLFEGERDGCSCAVLPFCRALSKKRFRSMVQRRALRPSLLGWLRQVTQATAAAPKPDCMEARFVAPLTTLAEHAGIPDHLRNEAERSLERLNARAWSPRQVLAHNDLWHGNVLIDHRNVTGRGDRPWRERFVIIDWPGAQPDGTPMLDLLCLSGSFKVGDRLLRNEVESHCRILECDYPEARSHLLVSLGTLLMNLEHFPIPQFIRVANSYLDRLSRIEC